MIENRRMCHMSVCQKKWRLIWQDEMELAKCHHWLDIKNKGKEGCWKILLFNLGEMLIAWTKTKKPEEWNAWRRNTAFLLSELELSIQVTFPGSALKDAHSSHTATAISRSLPGVLYAWAGSLSHICCHQFIINSRLLFCVGFLKYILFCFCLMDSWFSFCSLLGWSFHGSTSLFPPVRPIWPRQNINLLPKQRLNLKQGRAPDVKDSGNREPSF